MKNVLVIGATGDVGQGIVAQFLTAGYRVLAAGRSAERLATLAARFGEAILDTVVGSVEDEAAAIRLLAAVRGKASGLDAVITSVNLPLTPRPFAGISLDELTGILRGNVGMHFVAAKTFVPAVNAGGLYLGIGGGMADNVFPDMGHIAMCQAAQRNMFRALALDYAAGDVRLRELLICSLVAGASNRATAHPKWITDQEIGRYVRAIFEQPASFADTILSLKSKAQVAELSG